MISKVLSRFIVSVLGCVFVLSLCIGLPGANANDENDCNLYGCDNDCKFTIDFRLEYCKFKATGVNPYLILKPGYQLILESDEEKAVETVLQDTKWIDLDGRKIKTRVVEERAWEENEESGELVLVEISRNWFAICKKTNDVYYFGEDSRDCSLERGGFDPNDETKCLLPEPPDLEDGLLAAEEDVEDLEPDTSGSWEAGVNGAQPGIIMPGTFLLGAKYFQEIAKEDEAVDRGQNVKMGLTVVTEAGTFEDCVKVIDTNPAEGVCSRSDGDPKKILPRSWTGQRRRS